MGAGGATEGGGGRAGPRQRVNQRLLVTRYPLPSLESCFLIKRRKILQALRFREAAEDATGGKNTKEFPLKKDSFLLPLLNRI